MVCFCWILFDLCFWCFCRMLFDIYVSAVFLMDVVKSVCYGVCFCLMVCDMILWCVCVYGCLMDVVRYVFVVDFIDVVRSVYVACCYLMLFDKCV